MGTFTNLVKSFLSRGKRKRIEINVATKHQEIHPSYIINRIPSTGENFSLDGFDTDARVIRIVDGDSLNLLFKFRGCYDVWKCRICGIDTPELRGGTDETKLAAQQAKDFMHDKLDGKIIKINCKEFDSFGRLMVIIEFEGEDIGETLISNGHAVPFMV
jgi:endonuclease YncB( thermonuclease family)